MAIRLWWVYRRGRAEWLLAPRRVRCAALCLGLSR